jgi:adenine deaminase
MWQDFITGHLPRPDLTNLDLYSDIGSQCDHDAVETLDEAAYRARYVNAMAYRQALAVRSKDNRLWSAAS